MSVWAIVVAAGSGTRFGGPKQTEDLFGRSVAAWSVAAAKGACSGVVVVGADVEGASVSVDGGSTRAASVRAGLAVVPDEAEIVVVHDAVRPLATTELFAAVIAAVRDGADGAVPGLPVVDTVKRVADDGSILETVERSNLVAVQTPQAFDAAILRRAHESGDDATDDAALVEAVGGRVVVVPGDVRNRKITVPDDLTWARAMMSP